MSNEYEETQKKEYNYLDNLKKKKIVQPRPQFTVHLNRGTREEPATEKPSILFSDKRNENEINRNLVLERLHKYSHKQIVENKNKLPLREPSVEIPMVPMKIIDSEPEPEPPSQKIKIKIKKKMTIASEPETEKPVTEEEEPEIREPIIEEAEAEPIIEESEFSDELSDLEEEEAPSIKPKKGKKTKEAEGEEAEAEGEEAEAEGEVSGKPGKKKTLKKYEPLLQGKDTILGKDVKIGKKSVLSRLPKREKFVLKTSEFYMNNRKLYIQKIAELFKPYKKELLENMEKKQDDTAKTVDFKLLTHQKVVRDYLNLYTPYRGLLIYHMLGSGKSCTSIAVAEGMKSQRPVVLMTPASLKMNFFGELKKCGDLMYRRNQYWEFIRIEGNPEYVDILSKVLLLSKETIQKNGGAWLVDYTQKVANFNDLSTEEQKSIDQQIDAMIRSKYLDINYNGLSQKIVKDLTDNFTKNPFDNTTVIIDEAHNFVSRIVNKIKKPKSLSYLLYDYLMKAQNARIVLVTGTPIINYPNELGVLFNILRGYIKKWTFQLNIKNTAPAGFKVNREEILNMFHKGGLKTYDYIEYSGNNLVVTRNPFGFINVEKKQKKLTTGGDKKNPDHFSDHYLFFGGKTKTKTKKEIKIKKNNKTKKALPPIPLEEEETVEYNDRVYEDLRKGGDPYDDYAGVTLDETGNISDDDFKAMVVRILNKNHLEIIPAGSSYQELKALPDDSDTFLKMFINDDVTGTVNISTFKKRVLGLTSYFRSGSENLMPRFVKTDKDENYHIVPIEMSDYQFSVYEEIRKQEAEKEKKKGKSKNRPVKQGEEVFEIPSTYRIFSRAACNFAFPNPPGRPMPDGKIFTDADYEAIMDLIEQITGEKQERFTKEGYKEFQKESKFAFQKIGMIQKRLKEILEIMDEILYDERIALEDMIARFHSILETFNREKRKYFTEEEKQTMEEIILFIENLLRKYNHTPEIEEEKALVEEEEKSVAVEEDVDGESGSPTYMKRIRAAMDMLKYDPEKSEREQYLGKENLKSYSPKFLRILENIQDPENKGLHLLYSQFRTIEGVGIMKLVLETNGFAEFKIRKKESSNMWEIVESEEDAGKPRFVLYTGTETAEEKEIIRNVYNGSWEIVPASITTQLREKASNNMYGEIIKLLIITSSGAEGINLRNTRFVHITEPYWHMVRLEQVIGRARRIGSHLDLPEEERTVKVFLYLSVFSQEQITNKKNIEMMNRDMKDGKSITTDENLFMTALNKEKINHQLLDAVKETAIDCQLYNPFNKEENLVCYGFGKVTSNAFSSYPDMDKDLGEMDDINQKKTTMKLKASKPIDGVIYAIDPKTMNAYDMDSYKQAQEGRGELVQVGKMEKVGNQFRFVPR